MDAYQERLFEIFEEFRQEARYPTYPPYHEGLYLEEYFCKKIQEDKPKLTRYFIPIHWTNCYNDGYSRPKLKYLLSRLNPQHLYFVVMTHDDAPRERLPPQTISLSGGGLAGQVPIPLIGSGFKEIEKRERDIFCSFVGSNTHPLRVEVAKSVGEKEGFYYRMKGWEKSISQEDEIHFKEMMERSIFSLCPRGYGPTSFRMYEAIQAGSIPVYVYDKLWIPYEQSIDWEEFAVLIPPEKVPDIEQILRSISPEQQEFMRNKCLELYEEWFTIPGVYNRIIGKLSA